MELTDEERQDMKDRIVENTETITEIINELLELAQSESQNLAMEFVVISEVCQEVLQRAEQGNEKGLRLQLHNEVGGRFRVKSNREIITHILERIMDNAMKFTEKGSIIIRLAHPRRKLLEVSITDTGVGVPDAQREKIFDKFVKLDDYKGGVGLGLPICRHLARLLGGDVLLDAEYKKGSRFILQLPC
jgi:signal transduction histidine kinase